MASDALPAPWWRGRCREIAARVDFLTAGEHTPSAGIVEQVLLVAATMERKFGSNPRRPRSEGEEV